MQQKIVYTSEEFVDAGNYWTAVLAEKFDGNHLPYDYHRMSENTKQRIPIEISESLCGRLLQMSKGQDMLLYLIMLSAFYFLLNKVTGQKDIVVAVPVHTGNDLSGNLHNKFIVLRNTVEDHMIFKDFLAMVRQSVSEAYKYQYYPLPNVLSQLQHTSLENLCEIFFIYENIQSGQVVEEYMQSPANKIYMRLQRNENGLSGETIYHDGFFTEETIQRFHEFYHRVLTQVAANTEIRPNEVSLLTTEERDAILLNLNGEGVDYPHHETIHGLFQAQARKTPDHIALTLGERILTYAQLEEQSDRLAAALQQHGVKPGNIVGLMLERSFEMIIGILGVLKVAAVYLPINPDYPSSRIQFMLEDSDACLLVTEGEADPNMDWSGVKLGIQDLLFEQNTPLQQTRVDAGETAYVIYTSGTTGRPKGAMITHRNVVRLFFHNRPLFDFHERDVWTMFHSFCFDFSVWEMYGALFYGGRLVIIPQGVAQDTGEFLEILVKEQVTVLNQTPSAFYNLMREEAKTNEVKLGGLRYVIFGGEALKPKMLREWARRYPTTRLINMYGITETTVHVTYKEITAREIETNISNIGKPIPTLSTYIMDRNLRLQPVGIAGELCVGGAGVGRGYLNRTELTSEKFVDNPFRPGEKLYRSGDLARLLPNGEMEYLGRIDQQVKIRGFRIELGEIENEMLRLSGVREVIVTARGTEETRSLCAYYTGDRELLIDELRTRLQASLPDYMIPSYFIRLERFPLTGNGKIDHAKLPDPADFVMTGTPYIKPENEIQEKLVDLWAGILEITPEKIGIDDNFFSLGGNSISIVRMHFELEKEYPGQVSVTDLFAEPTIRRISSLLMGTVVPSKNEESQDVSEIFDAMETGEMDIEEALRKLDKL